MHNRIRTIPLFFEPMSFFSTLGLTVGLSISVTLIHSLTGSSLTAQGLPQAYPLKDGSQLPIADASLAESLDMEPTILENSPVLQRWLEEVPDVLSDIERDPSFRSRIRVGYSQGWSDRDSGFIVGAEDVFLGATGLTVSGDYRGEWDGDDEQYGLDLRYYLLPLGKTVNVATVLGYRHVNQGPDEVDGANVGIRLLLVPARTGAADISLTQTWVDPGSDRALSRFILSAGYALTPDLRLSTDFQVQTSDQQSQTDVGLLLEWLL